MYDNGQGGALTAVDSRSLRGVLSRFATGVVVLSVGGPDIHAMTANAFSSLSLDPPMVLCCVACTARIHPAILTESSFAVSILGADQEWLARHFANRERPIGVAQFAEVDWRTGPHTGAPLLLGASAWLECQLVRTYDGGDHSIFVGAVLDAGRSAARHSLLFFDSGYDAIGSRLAERGTGTDPRLAWG